MIRSRAAGNQADMARNDIMAWLSCDGEATTADPEIKAANYYITALLRGNFNADTAINHSDDYDFGTTTYGVSTDWKGGYMTGTYDSAVRSYQVHFENEHVHWYGLPLLYYVTGDEHLKESIDEFAEMNVRRATSALPYTLTGTRLYSWYLFSMAALYDWTGDSAWLTRATTAFNSLYDAPVCTASGMGSCTSLFIDWDGRAEFPEFTDKGFVAGDTQAGWYGGLCSASECYYPGAKTFYLKYILFGAILNYYHKLPDGTDKTKAESVLDLMASAFAEMHFEQEIPWDFFYSYGYNFLGQELSARQDAHYTGWAQYPVMWGIERGLDSTDATLTLGLFHSIAKNHVRVNTAFSAGETVMNYPPMGTLLYSLQQSDYEEEPPAPAEPGEAAVDIVCDRWFDTRSLGNIATSAITLMGASTNEQKAIAVWRAMYHLTYSELSGDIIWAEPEYGITVGLDPMKTVNTYCVHWCDGLSRVMQMIWETTGETIGNTARKYYHMGHTMAEIDYQDADTVNRRHIFDCSQKWFVYDRTGTHIATAAELMNDASLLYRPSNTPIPDVINTSSAGTVTSGYWARRESGPIYDPTLSIRKKIKTNEKITLMFGNDGKPYHDVFANFSPAPTTDAAHGPYTIDYGNGIWEYDTDYDGETVTYAMSYPYIVSDFTVVNGDGETVTVSTDGGTTWSADLDTVNGWYDFQVKITGGGANTVLTLKTWVQLNVFALPQLWPGTNNITISGNIDENVTVKVTYSWTDDGGAEQNVTEIESTPYTYEIITDGNEWGDVTCTSIVIEAVSLVGSGNRTTDKESPDSSVVTLTLADAVTTNSMIGSTDEDALDTVANYVISMQDAITDQSGVATGDSVAAMVTASVQFKKALFGLMEHGTAAAGSINDVITAVKADRSNSRNKMFGLQCIYKLIGDSSTMFDVIDDFLTYDNSIDWGEDETQGWTHIAFTRAAAQAGGILWTINQQSCAPFVDEMLDFQTPANIDTVITGEEGVETEDTYQWNELVYAFSNVYNGISAWEPIDEEDPPATHKIGSGTSSGVNVQ